MLQDELRKIPSVDKLLHDPVLAKLASETGSELVTYSIRLVLETEREKVFNGSPANGLNEIIREVKRHIHRVTGFDFKSVINATGIILHTNLGRAPLGKELLKEIEPVLTGYSNLEFDLHTGKRGDRNDHISHLLKFITGAEDALVVNNNAAALLLILKDFAEKAELGSTTALPEGETVWDTSAIQVVKEEEIEFDGQKRRRFVLNVNGQVFGIGVKVMRGIQKAVKTGATKVKIVRQGKGKETSYIVLPQ